MPQNDSVASATDNTIAAGSEKGPMRTTTTPTPRAALRLRDKDTPPAGAVAVNGIRRDDQAAFRQFVDSHHHVMRDYLERRLRGAHDVSPEDVLQDALIRIWRQFKEWPTEPERRIIFLRQALKVAAIDAIRSRRGRNGTTPREYPIDFADLERAQRSDAVGDQMIREIGKAIARDAVDRMSDGPERIQRSVLLASFAALTDLERRALFMTARGDNGVQIAGELGVSHQQAREALMRARKLVRSLIEHADAGKLRPEEAKRLWELRDGKITGRPKREAQRHLDHCSTCQRILAIEDGVNEAGVRVFLPLPFIALAAKLFGTATAGSAAAATATTGAAGATGGASVGAHLGGTIAVTGSTATATGGGVLAGITAKVALGLAGLAVASSTAGVAKLVHDRQEQERRSLAASVATPTHDETVASRSISIKVPARVAAPGKTKTKARPKPKRVSASPATHRALARHTAPRSATTTTTTTTTASVATAPPTATAARAASTTFASTSSANTARPAPAATKPSSPQATGGEFVIGSR